MPPRYHWKHDGPFIGPHVVAARNAAAAIKDSTRADSVMRCANAALHATQDARILHDLLREACRFIPAGATSDEWRDATARALGDMPLPDAAP